jgi:hypothetical protein
MILKENLKKSIFKKKPPLNTYNQKEKRNKLHNKLKDSGKGSLKHIFELLKKNNIITFIKIEKILSMDEEIELKYNDDPHEWAWSIIETLKNEGYINLSLKRGAIKILTEIFFYRDEQGKKIKFNPKKFNENRMKEVSYNPEIKKIINN